MIKDSTNDNNDKCSNNDSDLDTLNNIKNKTPNFSECISNESYNNYLYYSNSFSNQNKNMNPEEMNDIFKGPIFNEEKTEDENQYGFEIYNKTQTPHLVNKKDITENEKENEITQPKLEDVINLDLFEGVEDNKDSKRKQKKLLGKKLKSPVDVDHKEKNAKGNKQKLFHAERDSQRKIQIDNFSIFLFEAIFHWIKPIIEKQIPDSLSQYKINPPDYKVFTHNTNYNYIRFFLDISYKYILQMTNIDKEKLEELFVILKIKKPVIPSDKKEKIKLTDKEYVLAKKLLIINKKIQLEENDKADIKDTDQESDIEYLNKDEINDIDKEKIQSEIIKLLKIKGYKDKNENELVKNDKVCLNRIFIESKLKTSRDFQNKNKILINEIEKITQIKELNMTLRELIIKFLSSEDFLTFYENKLKDIDIYFESINKYSLSRIYNDITCGFIIMVESKTKKNEKIIHDLVNYFYNKNINESEIQKYIDNYKNQIKSE